MYKSRPMIFPSYSKSSPFIRASETLFNWHISSHVAPLRSKDDTVQGADASIELQNLKTFFRSTINTFNK